MAGYISKSQGAENVAALVKIVTGTIYDEIEKDSRDIEDPAERVLKENTELGNLTEYGDIYVPRFDRGKYGPALEKLCTAYVTNDGKILTAKDGILYEVRNMGDVSGGIVTPIYEFADDAEDTPVYEDSGEVTEVYEDIDVEEIKGYA